MNITATTTHVDVTDVDVIFHCTLDDDRAAYRVVHDNDHVTVYLDGTPEQLGRFADAIMRAVSKHVLAEHEAAIDRMFR